MLHSVSAAGVLFVTLNDPARRNALNATLLAALDVELARAEEDEQCRAFVLRGAGGVFCAGGDFALFKAMMATPMPDHAADPVARDNRAFGAMLARLADLPVPTVAVVVGRAAGGGTGLAVACDYVLAHTSAMFATPEVRLGIPPAQIAPFVAARIGRPAAARLLCEGRRLDAQEALRIGLVEAVVEDVDAALLELIHRFDQAEPAALRSTKRILAQTSPRELQLDFAAECFARSLRSTASEGIAAFTAKRAPAWQQSLAALPEMPR
ncbi:MAG TPA: enoyl-CoA hydratase/isomerase family protein [Burkholderiaceae bacterium]|nr:enoyl-CoA hydratase/isomerase family protein [Burkholderiaceae bacterium]